MKNKKLKLKGTSVYIENDYTKKERKAANSLRILARTEREKGHKVKVGYMKICIDENWMQWDEKAEKLIRKKEISDPFYTKNGNGSISKNGNQKLNSPLSFGTQVVMET